jgi:hypothetical protein
LNVAVVGANLVEQHSISAPRSVAFGAAVTSGGIFIVDFDAVLDFDSSRLLGRADEVAFQAHVGGEVLLAQRFALRAGYIHDGARDRSAIAYGASVVTPQIALDFGGRTDPDDSTMIAISLRLFLQ